MVNDYHIPVMVEEVIELLQCQKGNIVLDATLGEGGHSCKILERVSLRLLIGIDWDPLAIEISKERLKKFQAVIKLINTGFQNIKSVLGQIQLESVDGVLFDLGISSHQVNDAQRGFSFKREGPLDMRMDLSKEKKAYDIVNNCPLEELEKIIFCYGEEKWAKKIARSIYGNRPISTTTQLSRIIMDSIPSKFHSKRIHPATKTFQAIRIAVNDELENLQFGLKEAIHVLNAGGRIVVISYHSLEDRIVKEVFKSLSQDCICPPDFPKCVCSFKKKIKIITKRPIVPRSEEIIRNPRARSAKIRAAEKI